MHCGELKLKSNGVAGVARLRVLRLAYASSSCSTEACFFEADKLTLNPTNLG